MQGTGFEDKPPQVLWGMEDGGGMDGWIDGKR